MSHEVVKLPLVRNPGQDAEKKRQTRFSAVLRHSADRQMGTESDDSEKTSREIPLQPSQYR